MIKKIIHQVSLSQSGGVQRSFHLYLSYALKKSNFNHIVFSKHNLFKNFNSIKEFHVNINKSLLNKIKFLYYINSKNYLVHFYNNIGSKNINRLLNFIPSSNIIFHERGTAWNVSNNAKGVYYANASKAKIIIANSNASKLMMMKRFGIEDKKIKVIFNGFLSKEEKDSTFDYNRYSNKFSVGYLGRLDTPKGVHILIEAAKKISNIDFFIAGQGILESNLKKLANGYKNIYFLGNVDEPKKFLLKMDMIVVPSIREPLGNTIIEAGYCKKPVIAANVDGIPEIIENGKSGLLIDPDQNLSLNEIPKGAIPIPELVINPTKQELQKPKEISHLKLCESILKLKENPSLRKNYGENLYKSVREKFNIETYFNELENIYKIFN